MPATVGETVGLSFHASRIFKGSACGSSLLPGPGHFANNNGLEYLIFIFTFYCHMETVERID